MNTPHKIRADFAGKKVAKSINFDADGEYVDELPVFEDEAAEFDALLEERGVISPGPRKEST